MFNFLTDVSLSSALQGSTSNVTKVTETKKLKPCCACPETKRARDACIIENGEANCSELIEAHKTCMRKMGFNI